jgi:hypothetical protein
MSVVVAMGKFTPIQTEYAIKDNLPKDAKHITAHIVVGTPGTMTDLMRRKVIDVSEVKVFVLDEADNMLDQDGLGDQTLRVKKWVPVLTFYLFIGSLEQTDIICALKHAPTLASRPNNPLLSNLPRPRSLFRQQIRTKLEQDRAAARRTLRGGYTAVLYGL